MFEILMNLSLTNVLILNNWAQMFFQQSMYSETVNNTIDFHLQSVIFSSIKNQKHVNKPEELSWSRKATSL